jgi:RNA-directed DNA polymerase
MGCRYRLVPPKAGFDRVNHDILMSRIARRVKAKRVLKLIRQYLQAGILCWMGLSACAVKVHRKVGRSRRCCRTSCWMSWTRNWRSEDTLFAAMPMTAISMCIHAEQARRVKASLRRFLVERLRLHVNEKKSAVARPWQRKFLGYTMTFHKQPRLKPALQRKSPSTLTRRTRPLNREHNRSTHAASARVGYILSTCRGEGIFEEVDGWLRRKLRCSLWRQWKRTYRRARRLMHRGLAEARAWQSATNGRGPWYNAGASHMNEAYPQSYFAGLGLTSLLQLRNHFQLSH